LGRAAMHSKVASAFLAICLGLAACTGPSDHESPAPEPEPQARNPFGLEDIADDFFGEELQEWASQVELSGGDDDLNAEAWASPSARGGFDSIDGEWSSRWSESAEGELAWTTGTATVKSVGERVFFLYRSGEDEYLCEALRDGNRLVGTYLNVDPLMSDDNGPWVGLIVGKDRIDGEWLDGRWDLRRVAADPG